MSMLILIAAMTAYPASGTIAGPPPPAFRPLPAIVPSATREIGQIRSEVREGRERGELTRRQARELRREAGEIGRLEARYAAGGLSEAEREELRARVEMLRALTRAKRSGALR